jgi:hypothetical protein
MQVVAEVVHHHGQKVVKLLELVVQVVVVMEQEHQIKTTMLDKLELPIEVVVLAVLQ